MIEVTYYYSACVGISTAEVSILCDPWFTEGAFDGSWFQYPKLENPIDKIGEYDYIYISHLHSDHYDPDFLLDYLACYPDTKVIIGDFQPNYLAKMMDSKGIKHIVTDDVIVKGDTKFKIFVNGVRNYDIDSALAVERNGHSVVNMNDNRYAEKQVNEIREFIGGDATIGLFSYALGSGHPQTFYDFGVELAEEVRKKVQYGIQTYMEFNEAFNPKVSIPFAGQYVLGGRLAGLNELKAVVDATEILSYAKSAVVLADGGEASIDTESLEPTAQRRIAYDEQDIAAFVSSLAHEAMLYEKYFRNVPEDAMPFERLLSSAYNRALSKSLCGIDLSLCIKLPDKWCVVSANKNNRQLRYMKSVDDISPRWELYVEPRHLFGLLTGVFHWDNAIVGSHYQTRRYPNKYNEDVQHFLYFLHI